MNIRIGIANTVGAGSHESAAGDDEDPTDKFACGRCSHEMASSSNSHHIPRLWRSDHSDDSSAKTAWDTTRQGEDMGRHGETCANNATWQNQPMSRAAGGVLWQSWHRMRSTCGKVIMSIGAKMKAGMCLGGRLGSRRPPQH